MSSLIRIDPFYLNQMRGNSAGDYSAILAKRYKTASESGFSTNTSVSDASLDASIAVYAGDTRSAVLSGTGVFFTKPEDPWYIATANQTVKTTKYCMEAINTGYSFTFRPFIMFFNPSGMLSSASASDRYGWPLWNMIDSVILTIQQEYQANGSYAYDHYNLAGKLDAVIISGDKINNITAGVVDYLYNSNTNGQYPYNTYIIQNVFPSNTTVYSQSFVFGDSRPITGYFAPENNSLEGMPYMWSNGACSWVNAGYITTPSNLKLNTTLLEQYNQQQNEFVHGSGTSYQLYYRELFATYDNTGLQYLKNILGYSTGGWPDIEEREFAGKSRESNVGDSEDTPGIAFFRSNGIYTANLNTSTITGSFYIGVRTTAQLYDNYTNTYISSLNNKTFYWKIFEAWGPFVIVYVPDSVNGLERNNSYRAYYLGQTNGTVRYPSLPIINYNGFLDFSNSLFVKYIKSGISSYPIIIYSNNALNNSNSDVATVSPNQYASSGEASTNYLRFPLNVTVFGTRKSNSDSTDVSTNSSLYDTRGVSNHPLEETIQVYNAYDIYASDSSSSHAAFLTGKIGDVSTGVTLSLSSQNRSFTFYVREVIKEEYFTGNDAASKQTLVYDYSLGSLDDRDDDEIYPYIGVMGKDGFTNFEYFDNDISLTSDTLNVSTKVSLSSDSLGEKTIDVSIHRQLASSNQKNIPDSNSIYKSSSFINDAISYTPHNIYTVTVTIPDTITTDLNASNNYFYLASSVIESLNAVDAGIRNPNNAEEIYLKVGINYTSAYLDHIVVNVDNVDRTPDVQTGLIPTIELWSVPPQYNPVNYDNSLWNNSTPHARKDIKFKFIDNNGNPIDSSFRFIDLITSTGGANAALVDSFYFIKRMGGGSEQGGIEYDSNTTYTTNNSGIFTAFLYPIYDSSESIYNSWFPYPSSGDYVFKVKAISSDVSINVPVKVHKTSSTFTAALASNSPSTLYAGTSIVFDLTRNGEESIETVFPSTPALVYSDGTTIPSGDIPVYTASYNSDHSQYTITFDNSLASTFNGKLIFTCKNYYNYYNETSVTFTVEPAVTGITLSYNGNVVATDGSIGNLGDIWYQDDATIHQAVLLGLVGDGVTTGNIIYSCDPSNGNIGFGGTVTPGTSVPATVLNTRLRNSAGTQYSLIAQSSIRPNDVSTYVTVNPKKITDTTYISCSSASGSNLNPGSAVSLYTYINGDEGLDEYIPSPTNLDPRPAPVAIFDTNGTDITNTALANYVTLSNAAIITDSVNDRKGISYALTINQTIENDITLYFHTKLLNYGSYPIDSSTTSGDYVVLNIKKTDATSITLYNNENIISGDLGNYWFDPAGIRRPEYFTFYGIVGGIDLTDNLRHIEYTLNLDSGINFVSTDPSDITDIPSEAGSLQGRVRIQFANGNNSNRNAKCTVLGKSIQTPSITETFNFIPLRISTALEISLTNNIITLGGSTTSTELSLTINGDESVEDASLQYKVNSGSYSYTVPNIINVSYQLQSGNRTKKYTIAVNNNVTTTTTITIKGLFLPHGVSSMNESISSTEVTLTVKPSATQYSISASIDSDRAAADKNKLYHDLESSDIIKIDVTVGSLVTGYIVFLDSNTSSSFNGTLEYYADGTWYDLTKGTSQSTRTSSSIYVRVGSYHLTIGSNPSLTLHFQAKDKDTASSSYDEATLTIQLGKVTYSQHTAPGDSTTWRGSQGDSSLYNNDTVQFIANYSPSVGTLTDLGSSFVVWSSPSNFMSGSTSNTNTTSNASYKGRSSAGINSVTSVTFGFKYSSNNIPAAVKGSNTYAVSHVFNVTSLGVNTVGNALSISPNYRILTTNNNSDSSTYAITRGAQVNALTAADITLTLHSGTPGSNNLTTSISGDTLTVTASGDPTAPCIYKINLSATNTLGDTITVENAGEVRWRSVAQATVTVAPSSPNDGSINYPEGDYYTTTNYTLTKGVNIDTVTFVRIWTGSDNVPTSAVNASINGNTVTFTALQNPGDIGLSDGTYNIYLQAVTDFGDTLEFQNAGTIYWAAGNTGFVLTPTPLDSSVSGFGGSANNGEEYVEYTVICTHNNGAQTVQDSWTVSSDETWCKCSAYSGSDGDKIRVYAQGECYGSNRVANLTFTSTHSGTGSSTRTVQFTQRYLTVTPEIAINPTSLTPFGAEASSTSKTVEVTRCVYVKKDSLATSSIPSREVQATWNRTQSPGSSWLSLNNTSGSQVTNINVIENIDTSSRSAVITFTTVKPGEFPSGLEITPASVNITVTQNATTYSTCVFEIDGVNDNRTLPVKAAAADVSLGISCYYTKTQSSAGVRVYPGWTISSIKDGNGNNIDWISNKSQQTTDNELWISIAVNATSNPRTGVITLVSNQYTVGSKTYVLSVTRTIEVTQGNAAVDFNVATINKTYDVTGVNAVNYNDLKVNTSGTDASWQMSLTDSASFITSTRAKMINGGEVIEPATGVEVKGDASIAVDFVSPNLLNGGQVTSSIPLYSIRRTITASRTASLTVVAVDNVQSTGTVNIVQAGYSWTPSITTTLTKYGIFDASDNSATLKIISNFDYTIIVPPWMSYTLDSNYPGIFDNNDDETEQRERRYNITFNCNFSNEQQTGTIEIHNNKHCTDEGELIGQQSKSLSVSQSTGARSIKLMRNNHEVEEVGSEDLEFTSLGETRQFIVNAICTDWIVSTSDFWITIDPSVNTTTPSSYENAQQITIRIDPYQNVDQGRTGSIVFTSVQDSTFKVTYIIVQEQASMYFVLAESLSALKDHIDGVHELERISGSKSISLGNISKDAHPTLKIYYVMYYYGSATVHSANATPGQNCITFVSSPLVSSTEIDDFAQAGITPPDKSDLYKLTISVGLNETVNSRPVSVKLSCSTNTTPVVNFTATQEANSYSAQFDVTGNLGNYIVGKGWVIPVYGGKYTFDVKNLLSNDTITIDRIYLDETINDNKDHSVQDYPSWYSVSYTSGPITYNNPRKVTITINPYGIKESQDKYGATQEGKLNQKFYSVIVVAHSSSQSSQADQQSKHLCDNNGNIIQAVQESIELNSQTSWELLSNDDVIDTATGSKKVYARSDNYGSASKTVYSQDTGRNLFGTIAPDSIDEDEPIANIENVSNRNLALDVRVGVKIGD